MLDIYTYTSYRQFLRDFYEAEKKRNPHFSHRYVALKVGFSSSGFFTKILQGNTNISSELSLKFAGFLKLKKREADYFDTLVQFDQAGSQAEKNMRLEKILSFRRSKVKIIEAYQYEYFKKWYYVAVRELLAFFPFSGDFKELGRMLDPPITPAQARKAVTLLEKLQLVSKDADGRYCPTDAIISTGTDLRAVAFQSCVREILEMAKDSIDRFPRSERDISSLVMHFSSALLPEIHERLAAFRRELLELVKNDPRPSDRVYQFGLQVYPLSRLHKGHQNA